MTTGNAYVHAGKLMVAADVLGLVADVAVKESQ
jgi:multidrug resistance efflux pump